tara:strand:+ start:85 stop:627 length:543 start_codon:yes stop_codon:yes gene_type:complete
MATVICKTYDGVERTITVEAENTCPLYSYGETHKEFTGVFEKPSAPDNPNYYNAPANSTPIAPPEAVEGKVRVFDEGAQTWSQIDNLRGIYYSVLDATCGSAVVVSSPWGPVPTGVTTFSPPVVLRQTALSWDTAAGGADAGIGITNAWSLVSTAATLTASQKLEKVGLSTEELKELLGL